MREKTKPPKSSRFVMPNSQNIWKHGLISIVKMFQNINWRQSVRGIYQSIATGLIEAASCDSVSIRLLALTGDEMIGYVFAGDAETLAKTQFPTLPINVGRMSMIFDERKPLVYDFNAPAEADLTSEEGIKLGYSHAVVIPLIAHESAIGAIDFMYKQGQYDNDPEQLTFLEEIGRLLGPLTDAMTTTGENIEEKVREETIRIGYELQDNFAQPLSVIALEADKAILAKDEGDDAQLEESLTKISDLSRQSFGMMSDEVAILQSASDASENLVEDIERYIESFRRQWGVNIDFAAPSNSYLVSNVVGTQAMRILHEALSNVLRHSHAADASVRVSFGNGAMGLSIEDNGCGFNMSDRKASQFGLKIMNDRAKSIGGKVTIASVVGEGTTVFADLPVIA